MKSTISSRIVNLSSRWNAVPRHDPSLTKGLHAGPHRHEIAGSAGGSTSAAARTGRWGGDLDDGGKRHPATCGAARERQHADPEVVGTTGDVEHGGLRVGAEGV